MKSLISTVRKLANMDPQSEAVTDTVQELQEEIKVISEQASEAEESFGKESMKDDIGFIHSQIDTLHSASTHNAKIYSKISSILETLKKAVAATERRSDVKARRTLASSVHKLAGIFQQVDTVEDLDKPLEQIEKAVHSVYGDQSKNSTYYFDRRGKGHHGE